LHFFRLHFFRLHFFRLHFWLYMDFLRLHMKKFGRSADKIEAVTTATAITVTAVGATTRRDRQSRRSHGDQYFPE
jgi:hypothetical protein